MFFNPPTDEDFRCAFSWHNIVWTRALCSVMYEYIHSEELLPLIRYLGPTGSPESHKHGYYEGGTRAKPLDNPPPLGYLLPCSGPSRTASSRSMPEARTFNVIPFLATRRDLYERAVLGGRWGRQVRGDGIQGLCRDAEFRYQGPRQWCRSLSAVLRIRARYVSQMSCLSGRARRGSAVTRSRLTCAWTQAWTSCGTIRTLLMISPLCVIAYSSTFTNLRNKYLYWW